MPALDLAGAHPFMPRPPSTALVPWTISETVRVYATDLLGHGRLCDRELLRRAIVNGFLDLIGKRSF